MKKLKHKKFDKEAYQQQKDHTNGNADTDCFSFNNALKEMGLEWTKGGHLENKKLKWRII